MRNLPVRAIVVAAALGLLSAQQVQAQDKLSQGLEIYKRGDTAKKIIENSPKIAATLRSTGAMVKACNFARNHLALINAQNAEIHEPAGQMWLHYLNCCPSLPTTRIARVGTAFSYLFPGIPNNPGKRNALINVVEFAVGEIVDGKIESKLAEMTKQGGSNDLAEAAACSRIAAFKVALD